MLASKYIICAVVLCTALFGTSDVKAFNVIGANNNPLEQTSSNPDQNKDSVPLPRDGKYLIESYGYNDSKSLKIGYFTIVKNEYKYYDLEDNLIDSGTLVYDVPSKQIKWQTGRFKKIGWGGTLTVEPGGKIHTVQLNNTTVAKNTIQ